MVEPRRDTGPRWVGGREVLEGFQEEMVSKLSEA